VTLTENGTSAVPLRSIESVLKLQMAAGIVEQFTLKLSVPLNPLGAASRLYVAVFPAVTVCVVE
jgi:hypothetical protein